jgi:hypothetical protein
MTTLASFSEIKHSASWPLTQFFSYCSSAAGWRMLKYKQEDGCGGENSESKKQKFCTT